MKRVAITGANGFIGSSLVKSFTNSGDTVKALMRKNSSQELIDDKSLIIEIDYTDKTALTAVLSDCDLLIHTAALTKARTWNEFQRTNIDLVETIVEVLNSLEHTIHFIFLSSQAAGGMAEKGRLAKECDIPKPLTWYGKSKLVAEQIIKDKCSQPWTIIRPVSVYGPGEKDFLQYFKMVKKHLGLSIGKQKLVNFISADELCDFIQLASLNPKAYREVFFAHDGKAYFQEDFLDAVIEVMQGTTFRMSLQEMLLYPVAAVSELFGAIKKKPTLINFQKIKEFKGENWLCSIEKARRLLDYHPQANLKKNISDTYKWYKEHQWL
ncbi:MAG: NAD(P)-dependent oxidoreductase [Candidatus Cloacimonetes bacterium]|nr:NAD(P)-dependent oxidoreductase [Candidatus Cloacimonadota bacterium]